MTFPERLLELMKHRGYWVQSSKKPNMKKLSLDAGLGPTAVREIIKRQNINPTLNTVTALAKALGVSKHYLISGDDEDFVMADQEFVVTDQEFWEQAALAALSASADIDELPETLARQIAEIAECLVAERMMRIELYKNAQ